MLKYFLIIIAFLLTTITIGHSGRTDSKGGHHNRISGGYHYHHGMHAHQHPNGICEYSNSTSGNNDSFFDWLLEIILGFSFLFLISAIVHIIKRINQHFKTH